MCRFSRMIEKKPIFSFIISTRKHPQGKVARRAFCCFATHKLESNPKLEQPPNCSRFSSTNNTNFLSYLWRFAGWMHYDAWLIRSLKEKHCFGVFLTHISVQKLQKWLRVCRSSRSERDRQTSDRHHQTHTEHLPNLRSTTEKALRAITFRV